MVDEPMVDEPMVDEPMVDEPMVDEHCRGVPAEPLRRYVAWYTGGTYWSGRPARQALAVITGSPTWL